MSDEEKKAIEYLKRHIIPCYGRKGTIEFMLNDIVLNLIEKQQKEIEELKEDNKKKSIVIIEYQDLYEKLQDKIKAKIEEVQNMKAKAKDIVFKSSLNYIETELKSLF